MGIFRKIGTGVAAAVAAAVLGVGGLGYFNPVCLGICVKSASSDSIFTVRNMEYPSQ